METFRNENMVSEMEEKSDNTVPERESDVITSEVEGKENENTVSYRKTKNDESELKCECETEDNAILETKPNVVDNMVSVLEEIYIENPVPAEIKQKCDVVDASDMENLMIVAEKLRMIGDEVNNIYETEPARRSLSKMKIRLKDSCFSIMTAMPEVAPDKLDTNIPTLKQNSTQPVESGAKEEKPRSRYKKQTRKTYYYHLPKTWNSKKDMTKSTPLASKGFSSKPKSGRSERHIPLHLDQKKIATKSTDEPLPISEDFDMTKQYDLKSIKESFHVSGSSILAFDSKADSELGYEPDYESDPEDNLQINKGIFYQPSKAIQNVSDAKYKTQSVPVSWKLKQILASPKRLTRNVTSTKPQAKAVAEHKGPTKTDDGTEGLTLSVTESEFSKPNATCNEDVLQDFSDSGLVLESAHAQACGYPVVVDGAPFVTNGKFRNMLPYSLQQ